MYTILEITKENLYNAGLYKNRKFYFLLIKQNNTMRENNIC